MTAGAGRTAERLAELRRAFDASFTEPLRAHGGRGAGEEEALSNALAIRAGALDLAVRIEELAGVEAHRRLVPLPGGAPGLLGLAGVRGQLVAVYDLADLLGARAPALTPGDGDATFRWLLLCAGSPGIGLAVEQLDGYVRYATRELYADDPSAGEHVRGALLQGGSRRGLLHVPSLVAAVLRRARGAHEPFNGDP